MLNQEYIRDAAKCALEFLKNPSRQNDIQSPYQEAKVYVENLIGENMTYPYQVFKALAELTLADLEDGELQESYDVIILAQKIGKKWDDSDKKSSGKNYKLCKGLF